MWADLRLSSLRTAREEEGREEGGDAGAGGWERVKEREEG